jgi:hypothetical protein
MTTYRIMRVFQGDYPRERLRGGLTLAEAHAHCTDPETSSGTCTSAEGKLLTQRRGPWFDAYYEEGRERDLPQGREVVA